MQSDWMKTRQTKYTLYLTIYLLVIVAVLILVGVALPEEIRRTRTVLDALSATNRSPFGAEGSPPFQQCSVSILGCGGGRAGIRQHNEGGGRCPYDVMHSNAPSGLDERGITIIDRALSSGSIHPRRIR